MIDVDVWVRGRQDANTETIVDVDSDAASWTDADVKQLLEGMLPMDEILRSSGQYGPRVPVPDDSDPQTLLLAFIGRNPLIRAALR